MQKSDTIGALAAALAKAQGQMQAAKKDSQNPFFRTSYADLASVWEACRDALTANGLAVIQTTESGGDGLVTVGTLLAHESGEWITGSLALKPVKEDPQGVGSAITYGRRYGLAAIVGVAPEGDDDGEVATGRGTVAPKATPAPQAKAQSPAPTTPASPPATRPASERPYSPDVLKADMVQRVNALTQRGVATVTDGQRGLVAASLELCFAGDEGAKENRHSVQTWLTGKESVTHMTDAWIRVLLGWLNPQKDSGGAYTPSPLAVKEAQAILHQAMLDAGQQEFPALVPDSDLPF